MEFDDNTNGYLWQICYGDNTVSFEWCHGVSDGRGGFAFFTSVIHRYFEVAEEITPVFKNSLESYYDKDEKTAIIGGFYFLMYCMKLIHSSVSFLTKSKIAYLSSLISF